MNNRVMYVKLSRKQALKILTGNLGRVIEKKDKIICYVDKENENKKIIELFNSKSNKNLEISRLYEINKPIYYIFDSLNFNYTTNILGYDNVRVIMNNCNFINGEYLIEINGKCRIDSCRFTGILDIDSNNLKIINSYLNGTGNRFLIHSLYGLNISDTKIDVCDSLFLFIKSDNISFGNVNINGRGVDIEAFNLDISKDSIINSESTSIRCLESNMSMDNIKNSKTYSYCDSNSWHTQNISDYDLKEKRIKLIDTLKKVKNKKS